jgi:hypothetical protein
MAYAVPDPVVATQAIVNVKRSVVIVLVRPPETAMQRPPSRGRGAGGGAAMAVL